MSLASKQQQLASGQFYIGRYLITPSKNQVAFGSKVEKIEPKVMEVLLLLASHQGQVLEPEFIFSQVWTNTVFSSGSIRRAIAILRKTLAPTSTKQSPITTHAKKGYSLDAKVTLLTSPKYLTRANLLIAALSVTVVAVLLILLQPISKSIPVVSQAIPITASNDAEFNAKLSPSGSHIGFIKTLESKPNTRQLWLQDMFSAKQIMLSDKPVREFAWSPSSQQVAFLTATDSGLEQLHLVDIKQQLTKHLWHLPSPRISSLLWGQNNTLYYLTKTDLGTELLQLSLQDKTSSTLLRFDSDFSPYQISMSANLQHLAIAGFNAEGVSQIKQYEFASASLTDRIVLNKNRYFLSWQPKQDRLLISDGLSLYLIDEDQQQHKLNYQNFDFLIQPHFTPSGQHIVFTQAKLDIDLHRAENIDREQQSAKVNSVSLINSNTVDRDGALSPDSTRIAYVSHRQGYPQVFVYQIATKEHKLVYANEQKLLGISAPIWHSSGKTLAFSNYQFPILLHFDKSDFELQTWPEPLGVVKDWFNASQALLLHNQRNQSWYKLSLTDKTLEHLGKLTPRNVFVTPDEQLISVDQTQVRYVNTSQSVLTLPTDYKKLSKWQSKLLFELTDNRLLVFDLTTNTRQELQLPIGVNQVLAQDQQGLLYQTRTEQKDIVLLELR